MLGDSMRDAMGRSILNDCFNLAEDGSCQQRIAAKIEVIVLDSHKVHVQHGAPNLREFAALPGVRGTT